MKQSFILDGIETVFRTQEEWDVLNAPASYTPNAEIPNPEDYPEALRAKCANGTFIGRQLESGILAWFGIPFATQPVGALRFKKALPPPDSDKAYEAYHYMHYEYQPRYDGRPYDIKDMMGEDCLGLNIWSNPASDYEKKPVFVYVHGGGWYIGSSSNPLYRGELFTHYNPDILYISVDYRVGMYGQLNASLFADGADYPDACNNGLLDVVESLRWIKKNIAAFGGDPDNITLCGESAGGGCVSMVCALDCVLEEKLVQKAIPMSGNLSQAGRPDSTTKLPELLKEYFNTDSLAYIAGLPANRLADFWLRYGDSFHNCIMQDGNTICEDPYELYKNGKNRDIIFLQGFTGNESKYYQHVFGDSEPLYKLLAKANIEKIKQLAADDAAFLAAFADYEASVRELYGEEYEAYNRMLCDYSLGGGNYYQAWYHTKNGGKDYFYIFDKSYEGSWAPLGSAHAVDCNFLSGMFGAEEAPGNWEDLVLSRQFQKMISNFCKTGDPSCDGVDWKPFNTETGTLMYFGDDASFKLLDNYHYERYSNFIAAMDADSTLSLKYVLSQAYCYMVLQEMFGKDTFPDLYPPYKVTDYKQKL